MNQWQLYKIILDGIFATSIQPSFPFNLHRQNVVLQAKLSTCRHILEKWTALEVSPEAWVRSVQFLEFNLFRVLKSKVKSSGKSELFLKNSTYFMFKCKVILVKVQLLERCKTITTGQSACQFELNIIEEGEKGYAFKNASIILPNYINRWRCKQHSGSGFCFKSHFESK